MSSLKRHYERRIKWAQEMRAKHGIKDNIMRPDPPESRVTENGRELLTVGAGMWLNCLCKVLVKMGHALEAYYEGDPVHLWIRNLEGALSFAEIPNEAINNRDYDYILRQFMSRPAAKHLIGLERELYGR